MSECEGGVDRMSSHEVHWASLESSNWELLSGVQPGTHWPLEV